MLLTGGIGQDCWEFLVCKEIKPVYPKGNQSWIFIGRTDAEAEAPILWPHALKNRLIGIDPDTGKDWKLEEKGMTEDEMVGWHHRLDGHKLEQVLGVGDGQGSLACYSPWGLKSQPLFSSWTVSSVGKESPYSIGFDSWDWKICWRKDRLPTPVYLSFHCGSGGEESACSLGYLGLIPGLGRCPVEGKCYSLRYSSLGNSMDCIFRGVTKSWTQLGNFHFLIVYSVPFVFVWFLLNETHISIERWR